MKGLLVWLRPLETPSADTVPSSDNKAGALAALPILTKEQAAQLLGCKPRYIERRIKEGRLHACKPTGKFVRIFRKDLDSFLNKAASISLEATP